MSQLTFSMASEAAINILHITDTHLFADKNQTLLGVNTWQSFDAVISAVAQRETRWDLIVASGDLTQDQSAVAYGYFADGIRRLSTQCVFTPGNHDDRVVMNATLTAAGLLDAKRILIGEHWQVLLLDSQLAGVPHGLLSEQQLTWLDTMLAKAAARHTLLFLHHHPWPCGCDWLDQHRLRNTSALEAILQRWPLASTLVCGHIHQALDKIHHGYRLLTSPSTCIQFKMKCAHFTVDTCAPGWRELTLYPDGRVESLVQRLCNYTLSADVASQGY